MVLDNISKGISKNKDNKKSFSTVIEKKKTQNYISFEIKLKEA